MLKPAAPRELTSLEKCANEMLIIDRSLSALKAFAICEASPNQQAATWLAVRSFYKK
jgi:hypothetical protein